MKKITSIILVSILLGSCTNAWNEDDGKAFKQACLDDAKTWTNSPEQAITYCNCVIPKIKEKYPNEQEAIKQISTLSNDKDIRDCRDSLFNK